VLTDGSCLDVDFLWENTFGIIFNKICLIYFWIFELIYTKKVMIFSLTSMNFKKCVKCANLPLLVYI